MSKLKKVDVYSKVKYLIDRALKQLEPLHIRLTFEVLLCKWALSSYSVDEMISLPWVHFHIIRAIFDWVS